MYVIEDNTGKYFCSSKNGKKVFVSDEKLAKSFPSEREASDYIRKNWKKKSRSTVKPTKFDDYVSEFKTREVKPTVEPIPVIKPSNESTIAKLRKEVHRKLTAQIEDQRSELKKTEMMLSDVEHFLRESETKLNVYQCYLAIQKMQKLLRDRSECKKELQRLYICRAETGKAFQRAEDFTYKEYKNKVIPDVRDYLFSKQAIEEGDVPELL